MNSPKVTLERPLVKPPLPELFRRRIELKLRMATSGIRALPDFIIAGAQKCGTSSMHQYFTQHPRLLAGSIKEVHFFDGGLDPLWDKYSGGEALYRSYFPLRATVRQKKALCFEASPDYIFNPMAAERMADMVPDAKIVVLLRDPVERAISHYFHELRRGRETENIETAFALEESRIAPALAQGNFKDTRFINLSYCLRGHYADQLERLFAHYPREQVLVLEAESFFEDPLVGMGQVLEFVGMEGFPYPVDVKPTGTGGNKKQIPEGLRDMLKLRFDAPNRRLADLLEREFRWT